MRQVSLIAGLIVCVLICSFGAARADALSAGVSAYARQQYVVAARYLEPEAKLGNPVAQTYLGFMYQDGRGVPQDYIEAVHWFRAAALQGEPNAQFFLALLYDRGLGVTRDFVEAEVWLDLATAHARPHERDYWARMRDAVASKLTLDELARARTRALEFTPTLGRRP